MLRATKVRIYPTPEQEAFLTRQFGAVRFVWNKALAVMGHRYRVHGESLSAKHDMKPLLAVAKRSRRYGWFIFIHDLVAAIRRAASAPAAPGEVFQIASASETTISELVGLLVPRLEAVGLGPVSVTHGPRRLGDVMRNFSDTSKAARILGWRPAMELPHGLDATVAWFLERAEGAGG